MLHHVCCFVALVTNIDGTYGVCTTYPESRITEFFIVLFTTLHY